MTRVLRHPLHRANLGHFDSGLSHSVMSGLAALAWVLFSIVALVDLDVTLSWTAGLLFFLFAYASLLLWRTVLAKRAAPLELMFWLYNTHFLLLPALSQSLHRTFFWSAYTSYSQEVLVLACSMIAVGIFSFRIGSTVARKRLQRRPLVFSVRSFFARPLLSTWPMQIFLAAILVVLTVYIFRYGVDFFTALRMQIYTPNGTEAESGLLLTLPRALAAAALLFLVALCCQRWRQSRHVPAADWVLLIWALGVNGIVNWPLSLPRFWAFGLVIGLVLIVKPLTRVRERVAYVIGVTIMQFTVLPWYSYVTRATGNVDFGLVTYRKYLLHGDFDGLQSMVNAILFLQNSGLQLGRNLLSVFLFFVPRAFWEGKAEPLGKAAAQYMGYPFTNISSPIYAELYADYGLVSLVLGMGLLGFGIVWLDAYYGGLAEKNRDGGGFLMAAVLAGYLVILLRGSLLAVVSGIAVLAGVLFVASWLAGRRWAAR